MFELLQDLHRLLRVVHISLGFAGLALFWLIVALPKGTPLHRRCGKLFAGIAAVVGCTAIISSLWALVHLESFAPWLARADSDRQLALREQLQFMFAILLFLSLATVTGAVFGVRVMRKRDRHAELRRGSLPYWEAMCGLCAVGLIAFGSYKLFVAPAGSGPASLPWAAYHIPLVLGLFGLYSVVRELRYIFGPQPEPRAWLYMHIEQMFGMGVAFHTAFIVFGASRLLRLQLPGAWALLPWVLPLAIGIGLTHWYIVRLQRKNGDLPI